MKFEFEISYTDTEAINMLDSELSSINDIEVDKIEQSGFDGLDILFYFIQTGGAVCLIKSITKIIVKMIERNDIKSFKFNNIECKGYSKEEVEDLLEKASKLPTNNTKKK